MFRACASNRPSGLAFRGGKPIDSELRPHRFGCRGLLILERNPCRIGNTVDCVKQSAYAGSVDQRRRTKRVADNLPTYGEFAVGSADHGFRKSNEKRPVGNPAIALGLTDDGFQIDRFLAVFAARTEQAGVAGRSINALVYR